VIVNEAQWHDIARELAILRKKPKVPRLWGDQVAVFFGRENDDPNNSVSHLDAQTRNEFRSVFFSILTKRRGVKIIGCVTKRRERQ
jgi:hypothetical protein